MVIAVIDPGSAFCILGCCHRINKSGADITVNIAGRVLCVSEIFRIKDCQLFMVKMLPHVDIIIKNKEMLTWHRDLMPYKEYVFTNLKPTTVQQGSQTSCKVYTVTADSQMFKLGEVETTELSAAEWYTRCGLQQPVDLTENCEEGSVTQSLFSYQGKVTKVLDQCLGVFELDDAVRLYTGTVPAVHKFRKLREGTTVLLQNAHHSISKQYPKVTIYFCMLTSVRFMDEKQNRVEVEQSNQHLKLSERLKKMLYLEGQGQGQMEALYELRNTLSKQFLSMLGHRQTEKILDIIIGNNLLVWRGVAADASDTRRSFIEEFVSVPHCCCLQSRGAKTMRCLAVKDVLEDMEDISTDSMEWQCRKQLYDGDKVLTGILKLSSETGQVVLCDATGSVDVVTCCQRNLATDSTPVPDKLCRHVCSVSCDDNLAAVGMTSVASNSIRDRPLTSAGSRVGGEICDGYLEKTGSEAFTPAANHFCCPHIQICCLDKVVAMKEFQLISETCYTRCINDRKDFSSTVNGTIKYIMLDMRNVTYLCSAAQSVVNVDTKCTVKSGNTALKDVDQLQKNLIQYSIDGVAVNETKLERKENTSLKKTDNCNFKDSGHLKNGKSPDSDNHSDEHLPSHSETPLLHKHTRENGTVFFCRKTECEKGSTQCLASRQGTVSKNSDVVDSKGTNISPGTKEKAGRSVFIVKPLSARKRPWENTDTELKTANMYGSKISRTDAREEARKQEDLCVENEPDFSELQRECSDADVMIHLERKESLIMSEQSIFHADCTLISKMKLEKVVLEFSGEAVRWYPVLFQADFYKFSVPDSGSAVLSDKLPSDKIQRVVQHSKARRCLRVNASVQIIRIWRNDSVRHRGLKSTVTSIEHALDQSFSGNFVSFEGWIVSRTLVKPGFGPKSSAKDISGAHGMYSRLHVQDASGTHDIWVYLNDDNIVYPHGMIPGSYVRFHTLERKKSKSLNVYCRFVPLTSVQILCTRTDSPVQMGFTRQDNNDQQLSVKYLSSLWTDGNHPGHMFQCVCDIEKVLKVSLKCLCLTCGSVVADARCSNPACKASEGWRFLARSTVIVDDSTSVAMMTLTGSSVQSMLQLSHDHWKCLEDEVCQAGEVFIQQYNQAQSSDLERLVCMLCENPAVKQPWLMTLKCKSAVDISKINHDEFSMKSFETGSGRVSTQCLPFLQLEVVAMETFQPAKWAVHCLSIK